MLQRALLLSVLLTAVYAELLTANDAQTCTELCNSCQGTASFVDGRCECYVSDANEQGGECILRIKRQAEELGLDLVDCEPATADRPARCSLGSTRTVGLSDADRIVSYFMNGGPITGTPMLAKSNCDTDQITGASNPASSPKLAQLSLKLEPVVSKAAEPITGAANPSDCVGAPFGQSPQLLSAYYRPPDTFVGAPAPHYPIQSPYSYVHTLLSAALHPHTLGLPHVWTPPAPVSGIVGATHPPLISLLSSPAHVQLSVPHVEIPKANVVGSSHKTYTPPAQILKERQMVSAPSPVVQPGYTMAASNDNILPLLKQVLHQQNTLLENISRYLQAYMGNVGSPRVVYKSEPQVSAPAPKPKENCPCPPEKEIVSSKRKNDCDDTVLTMQTPGLKASIKRPPRMSPAIDENLEAIERMEKVEPVEKVDTVELTTERPKREMRPDANGRKRKRDLKKTTEAPKSA